MKQVLNRRTIFVAVLAGLLLALALPMAALAFGELFVVTRSLQLRKYYDWRSGEIEVTLPPGSLVEVIGDIEATVCDPPGSPNCQLEYWTQVAWVDFFPNRVGIREKRVLASGWISFSDSVVCLDLAPPEMDPRRPGPEPQMPSPGPYDPYRDPYNPYRPYWYR